MLRILAALALSALIAQPVRAQDPAALDRDAGQADTGKTTHLDPRWQIPILVLENAAIGIPAVLYYWNTVSDQKEDWELRWDWPSWKSKLTSTDPLVLDTNRFMPNGIRHPLTGALVYQTGRANDLGPWGALAIDVGHAVAWEYLAEYREKPSINDIFTNTMGGILIGEPLFQLGRLGDGGASLPRRGLSLVTSPAHRLQSELGLSWLPREPRPYDELFASAAPSVARIAPSTFRPELAVGLDLTVVRDRHASAPGSGTTTTGMAGWNHELLDLRLGDASDSSGVTGARFRSETTYLARYDRDFDDDGNGSARLLSLAGGVELNERRLANEWDRLAVFELVGPRLDLAQHRPGLAIDWQLAAYPNVAMVQAHVFGDMPRPAEGMSVLLWRGYYYATGATVATRLRVRSGPWDGTLDATAHQFWSFDDHSHGGSMDPRGVEDERVTATARVGVRPTASDLFVHVFGDSIVRRGSWNAIDRTTGELAAGIGVTAGF